MRTDELDFDLPADRVAQQPAGERDGSRLMLLRGSRGAVERSHHVFRDLPELLRAGDLLVVNDTRVLPARLFAWRETGGRVELLLVEPKRPEGAWQALVRPARRVRVGDVLRFDPDAPVPCVQVLEASAEGRRVLAPGPGTDMAELMERYGRMPLPPYVQRTASGNDVLDRDRYQTVYASSPGAIAAPTAGLHLTEGTFAGLARVGVEVATITLHVGPGTFRPLSTEHVEEHRMSAERCVVDQGAATAVRAARGQGRRVIAVGTTAVRTLESMVDDGGELRSGAGLADAYITPGYRFRVIDGMITNFHLPRSTPLLLVAALIGLEPLREAYQSAIARGYRFYSYGDAMLVLP